MQFLQKIRNMVSIIQDILKVDSLTNNANGDPDRLISAIFHSKYFRPEQIPGEIKKLMEIVQENRCKNICEIGCKNGGTLYLLSQVSVDNARLISIDIKYLVKNRILMRKLLKSKQLFTAIQGDSKDSGTISLVQKALHGEYLDLLLIDGDHSYEGIKNDFEKYAPLVRKGGLIVFHDVNPDAYTRTGIKTGSYVGGVPIFWQELKQDYRHTYEIIENMEQDGYGIGILTVE